MPFDGRDYTDAIPVRRGRYNPRNPHLGITAGQNLRNAYFFARHHGNLLGAQAWPLDSVRPNEYGHQPDSHIRSRSPVTFWRVSKWVGEHFTHALAHVVFSPVELEGTSAFFQLRASNTENGSEDSGSIVTIPIGPASSAAVPSGFGSPWENPLGTFEGLASVELANVTKNQVVHVTTELGAEQDGPGGAANCAIVINSVTAWLESIG